MFTELEQTRRQPDNANFLIPRWRRRLGCGKAGGDVQVLARQWLVQWIREMFRNDSWMSAEVEVNER